MRIRRVDRLIEGLRRVEAGKGVFYPLLYYMPIALRFSSEYPANRVTARPRCNNGRDGGEGEDGEAR